MTTTAVAVAGTYSEDPICPSCGLPGELWTTPTDEHVLLESNDPAAPLRVGAVPGPYRWIIMGHRAHPAPEAADLTAVCHVSHAAVCPRMPLESVPPSLLRRRRLNEARYECARLTSDANE